MNELYELILLWGFLYIMFPLDLTCLFGKTIVV